MSDTRAANDAGIAAAHAARGTAPPADEPPAHEHHPALAHHFDGLAQQRSAVALGIWLFLVTEIMFFGGLFLAYSVYRVNDEAAFAEASRHLDWKLGAANTVVLLLSSLTMALAVRAAQLGRRTAIVLFLGLTIVLGGAFLGVKTIEYGDKFAHHLVPGHDFRFAGEHAEGAQLFFSLYFAMTGVHAAHMVIGIGVLFALVIQTLRNKYDAAYHSPVEMTGLYWHFVDVVWIFLFPLLYLLGGPGGGH